MEHSKSAELIMNLIFNDRHFIRGLNVKLNMVRHLDGSQLHRGITQHFFYRYNR